MLLKTNTNNVFLQALQTGCKLHRAKHGRQFVRKQKSSVWWHQRVTSEQVDEEPQEESVEI